MPASGTAGADARPRSRSSSSSRTATACAAKIVGWDLFDDVGVLRVEPDRSRVSPRAARRLGGASSSASPSRRSGARSGSRPRSPSASSRRPALDLGADFELPPHRRDPDRRADQPRQLRRAALRRSRPRDRHQRADPQRVRKRGGRRVRGPDQLREALAGAADRDRAVAYAYVGISTDDLTPALARRFGYAGQPRRGRSSTSRVHPPARRGLRAGDETVVVNGRGGHDRRRRRVAIAGRPVRSGDDLVRIVTQPSGPASASRSRSSATVSACASRSRSASGRSTRRADRAPAG